MSTTHSPSQDIPYGVVRVCEVWQYPRASFYRWRERERTPVEERTVPRKRGPKTELSDAELTERIRAMLAEVESELGFRGEGYRKVHARLRARGVRVGRQRVLRLMREHGLLAPTRVGKPRGPRVHDGTIVTELPDQMWGTDLTTTLTLEDGNASIFAVVDHCTGECLGLRAVRRGTRFEAIETLHQAVRNTFGSVEEGVASGLAVRHDHGSQFTSRRYQAELALLGIESSPSFVRAPEGNGIAERFFRTLKEQLLWIHNFRTVADLAAALEDFRVRYNHSWLLQRHGHRTPADVRAQLTGAAAA